MCQPLLVTDNCNSTYWDLGWGRSVFASFFKGANTDSEERRIYLMILQKKSHGYMLGEAGKCYWLGSVIKEERGSSEIWSSGGTIWQLFIIWKIPLEFLPSFHWSCPQTSIYASCHHRLGFILPGISYKWITVCDFLCLMFYIMLLRDFHMVVHF